jgi:hypothetical protein
MAGRAFRGFTLGAGLLLAALGAAPAAAEGLHTIWRMEPVTTELPQKAEFGSRFYEARVLPVRLMVLREPADVPGKGISPAGTLVFLVFNDDNSIAYCTVKDHSIKGQAKTLFIPVLATRPCFVDKDGDGRFEAAFGVFDKWGSVMTPSGSLRSAKPLPRAVRYEEVDPQQFPRAMKIAFVLDRGKSAEMVGLHLQLDKWGEGDWKDFYGRAQKGVVKEALNLEVAISAVSEREAGFTGRIDPSLYLAGTSGGQMHAVPLPLFLER